MGFEARLPVGVLARIDKGAKGCGGGSCQIADEVDVPEGIEAERRNELVDRVPLALLAGRVSFTPVALDGVNAARLGVEVDDVGRIAAVGQEGIVAVHIEVAMGLADRIALAFEGHVEALRFGDGVGDLVGVEGFFGVVLGSGQEGAGGYEVVHLANGQFHDLDVLFGVAEVGAGRISVEVLDIDDGGVGHIGYTVPAHLADAHAHEAHAKQVPFEVIVEAGDLLGKLVVHVGADARGSLFAGHVYIATDFGADGTFRGPEFLDGFGLELDDVLDEEGVDRRACTFNVGIARAIGVQAQPLDAQLDLLFPFLAPVLEVLEGVLPGRANVAQHVVF